MTSCSGCPVISETFPRQRRGSLGIAMGNRLQRVLELPLLAKYARQQPAA